MEYEIGDKVELESGKIVTITKIGRVVDKLEPIYGYGKPAVIIEERIIRKVDN